MCDRQSLSPCQNSQGSSGSCDVPKRVRTPWSHRGQANFPQRCITGESGSPDGHYGTRGRCRWNCREISWWIQRQHGGDHVVGNACNVWPQPLEELDFKWENPYRGGIVHGRSRHAGQDTDRTGLKSTIVEAIGPARRSLNSHFSRMNISGELFYSYEVPQRASCHTPSNRRAILAPADSESPRANRGLVTSPPRIGNPPPVIPPAFIRVPCTRSSSARIQVAADARPTTVHACRMRWSSE